MKLEHAIRTLEMHYPYERYQLVQEAIETVLDNIDKLVTFKEFWDSLYGANLQIINWFENEELKSFDELYEWAIYDEEGSNQ